MTPCEPCELKAHKVSMLIVNQSSRCPSVGVSTLSNINISETSGPIAIKLYLKHHWGEGWEKAALGFSADQIRTLVNCFHGNR